MDINNTNDKAIIDTSKKAPTRVRQSRAVEARRKESAIVDMNSTAGGDAAVRRTPIIETKKENKKPLPVGTIFTFVAVTLLFIFLLMNYAKMDNYHSEIGELKDELTELQKSADKLEQRLDKKNDLVRFEDYAINNLGMVKSSELNRINITSLPENTNGIFRYNDEDKPSGLGVLLSGFGDVIVDFFE